MQKLIGLFARKEDGTTAIEFSLMLMPYLLLSLGIIELSLMYASASLLEGATNSASRMIKTGQLQQGNQNPEEAFRDSLCNYMTVLVSCEDVQLEVVPMDSYASYDTYAPSFDEDGNLDSQGFDAGGSNDRIIVRTAYRYSMMTPLIGQLLAPSGSRLFMSTIVLQTEPYEFNVSGN